jgi:hypothetical protein
MNLPKILADLRRERDLLNETIACFKRLLATSGKPRMGRPPAWLKAHKDTERNPAERKQPSRAATINIGIGSTIGPFAPGFFRTGLLKSMAWPAARSFFNPLAQASREFRFNRPQSKSLLKPANPVAVRREAPLG